MRLTQVFSAFVSLIATVGAELAGKVVDAIVGAIGKPKLGAPPNQRPVDHTALSEGLSTALRPEGLHADGRELARAIGDEIAKRGALWSDSCLADALETHLIEPLKKIGDKPAAAGAKKGKA